MGVYVNPIAYASRFLSKHEHNYGITNMEISVLELQSFFLVDKSVETS